MRNCGNNTCQDERTNAVDGQPQNIMPVPILSGGKGKKGPRDPEHASFEAITNDHK